MKIKSFVLKFLIILIPLLLFLFSISKLDNLDSKWTDNVDVIRLQQKKNFDSLDILFIGGSYCYSGIYPKLFDSIGLKTFNLGIATAGPYYYELILNDYLATAKQKPKSIFMMVSPMSFGSIADNFTSYPIHRYLENPQSNEKVVLKYKRFSSDYFYLMKKSITKGITNLFLLSSKPAQKDIDEVIKNKGFLSSEIINTKEVETSLKRFYTPLKKEKFNNEKFEYLIRYSDSLKRIGVNVVFFEFPTNKLNDFLTSSYLDSYNERIKELGLHFKVLKNEKELDNECFRNFDHLNTSGAIKATRNLIEQIKKDSELKMVYGSR